MRKSHKYERTLYWTGQLYTESFDTSPVHVVEELDESETEAEKGNHLGVKSEA